MTRRSAILEIPLFVCCWAIAVAQNSVLSASWSNASWDDDDLNSVLYPSCSGYSRWIGDNICDEPNNNPACGYDGGDCCVCTSENGFGNFDCVDPVAREAPLYDCQEPPPVASPCANDTAVEWVVEDTAGAKALAEAVDCAGGAFQVEWRGTVAIDHTIYVRGRTVLNVTGLGSTACMDGNFAHRLFTVINASLNIENMKLSRGNASAGGAIAAAASRVALRNTSFVNNSAASDGGALYIVHSSNVSAGGGTAFLENFALGSGGAAHVGGGSSIFWQGEMSFSSNSRGTVTFRENSSGVHGGALTVIGGSTALWSTVAIFDSNTVISYYDGGGGALYVDDGSSVSWQADTIFFRNSVYLIGGALYVGNGSTLSSEAEVMFDFNEAHAGGGAIFVGYNCTLVWHEQTTFRNNHAGTDGGALDSSLSVTGESPSSLIINGDMSFLNNRAEANGGGIVITGSLKFNKSQMANMNFSGNSAGIAGGAVFITEAGVGPQFVNVNFVGNSAKIAGAIYVTQSGTTDTKMAGGQTVPHSTTFSECTFIDNVAETTGGAVESDAGRTEFIATLFKRNRARGGGALSLAGRASVNTCSFIENVSEEDGGAAISNTAVLSKVSGNDFKNNGFSCEVQKYLDFENAEEFDALMTACNGCDTECPGCVFDGGAPRCIDQIDHSYSSGGSVTLETLKIDPGHWRATNKSEKVLPCFNAAACLGGITGVSGYCKTGYDGPYCSICSDDYMKGPEFTCMACADKTGALVLVIIATILAMVVLAAFFSYLIFGERERVRLGFVSHVKRCIPVHTIKIIIVVWQILTQFASVANVVYPGVYKKFLDSVDMFNFDWRWILSTGCVWSVSFYDNLLLSTFFPLMGIAVLGGTYAIAARRNRGSEAGVEKARQRHLSMVILLTFLVYSSVSSTLFQAFACETLDDEKKYLRADYQIECDSAKHIAYQVYAGFMMVLYTAGIPVLYAFLLLRHRDLLTNTEGREDNLALKSTTDLWKPYKPGRYYYEIIECGRRILLTGVVVFIYPNTPSQIAVILVVAVFYMVVAESLEPYASRLDAWISRTGHVIVFLSMYVALLLKVDLSDERADGEAVFEAILVFSHACMVCAVVVQAIMMIVSWKAEREEISTPRIHRGGVISFAIPEDFSDRGDGSDASRSDAWYMEK